MRLIESLIDRLQRWIARYRVALNYDGARDRRRPAPEIEWNGAMISDVRRRSFDAQAVSCGCVVAEESVATRQRGST